MEKAVKTSERRPGEWYDNYEVLDASALNIRGLTWNNGRATAAR